MCECGCSSTPFQWKLPAPNRQWYVVRVYDSCRDCDAPAGVDISLASKSDMKDFEYDRLPALDVKSVPMIAIAVLHPDQLKARILEAFQDDPEANFDEVLVDELLQDTFRQAVNDTANRFSPATK